MSTNPQNREISSFIFSLKNHLLKATLSRVTIVAVRDTSFVGEFVGCYVSSGLFVNEHFSDWIFVVKDVGKGSTFWAFQICEQVSQVLGVFCMVQSKAEIWPFAVLHSGGAKWRLPRKLVPGVTSFGPLVATRSAVIPSTIKPICGSPICKKIYFKPICPRTEHRIDVFSDDDYFVGNLCEGENKKNKEF